MPCTEFKPCLNPLLRWVHSGNCEDRTKSMNIKELVEDAYLNSYKKGFHEGETSPPDDKTVSQKLMLISDELSEAHEEIRAGKIETYYKDLDKPEGFFTELGDAMIRIGDLAGSFPDGAYKLQKAIEEKMAYNKTRSYKHGKKF